MSLEDPRYGRIYVADAQGLEEVLHKIGSSTEVTELRILEIGVFAGDTAKGIRRFLSDNYPQKSLDYWGVDDGSLTPLPDVSVMQVVVGESTEVFHKLSGKFHLVFIDGCHCINHAILDFLHYGDMVAEGGYLVFHDTTSTPTADGWEECHQAHGPLIPEFCIGVRAGLEKVGLLTGRWADKWEPVLEVPGHGPACGIMAFRRK